MINKSSSWIATLTLHASTPNSPHSCPDAGGALESATERARLALWYGLHRACQVG